MAYVDELLRLVNYLAATLESIAGAEWLNDALAKPAGHRLHEHALVVQWRLCKHFEERVRAIVGGPNDMIVPFVGTMLDATMINMLNDALGHHNALFDRLASVFKDSRQYSNTMAEISAAAWCASNKLPITPCTGDAMPEFSVRVQEGAPSVFVECKRLEGPVTAEQIVRQLKRANRKIVSEPDGRLVLIMDLSDHVPVKVDNDGVPPEVQMCMDTAEEQLKRQKYRNLAAVAFTWDRVEFSPPGTLRTGALLRRFSRWLSHPHARRPLTSLQPFDTFGATVWVEVQHIVGRRNGACFCGSGQRYKHCHGRLVRNTPG